MSSFCICFSPACSSLDEPGNLSLAFSPGVSDRRYPILVRNIRISTGGENQFCNLHMSRSTIAKNDDLQETGPAEIVDVIHIYFRRQKQLHGFHVRALASRYQGISAEAIAQREVRSFRDHVTQHLSPAKGARQEPG